MNKLYVYLTAICLCAAISMNAQDKWGFRAGYQSAKTYNDGDKVFDNLNGFYVGLQKKHNIGLGILQLVSGLEYHQNGFDLDSDNYRRISYLGAPVGLRADIGILYVQGGLGLNLRLAEKYYLDGEEITDKSDLIDVPVHVGAGFSFLIFVVEARYHWGLRDIDNGNKNQYLQIGASVFPFRKRE
jgi:hypothetical protein